jgi:hypothetical protein
MLIGNQVDLVHMGFPARDTDCSAHNAQIEILRSMPAWRKLELLADSCETNRTLMSAGLRVRFPEASEEELHRMLMSLLWGEDTAARIWRRPLVFQE